MASGCPLCGTPDAELVHRDIRHFLQCPECGLIFVPPGEHLDAASEKARYDLHRNDPGDPDYRRFLARLGDQMLARLPAGAEGLDFGCGPGPALAAMLTDAGHRMRVYDPFYAPDKGVWLQSYDFITSSEVFEHLYRPADELDRLFAALKSSGLLGVMTSFAPPMPGFARWHYTNDPTHVCFYGRETFEFIARHWGATMEHLADNVAVLRKK